MQKLYSRIDWKDYPNDKTPLNEQNLNRMDAALNAMDDRVIAQDTTKADKTELNDLVSGWYIDEETGIITITKVSGEKILFDLNIEKIPVGFSLSDDGILTMTTDDGTEFTANIGAMIPVLTFADSDEISVSVSGSGVNKTYSFSIKTGSVTEDKLQPNYLAEIKVESAKAEACATTAGEKASESLQSALLSKSYSDGDSGIREGEETDNAKYYSEQAKNALESLEQAGNVTGVKGNAETTYRTGNVNMTKENIGLENVDNTADKDKPVSSAMQDSLKSLEAGLNKLHYLSVSRDQNPFYVVTESSEDTMYSGGRGAKRTSSEKALFVKYNSAGGYAGFALVGLTPESVETTALTTYGGTNRISRTTLAGKTYYIAYMNSAWGGGGSTGGSIEVTVTSGGISSKITKTICNLYPGQEDSMLALGILVDVVLVLGYRIETISSVFEAESIAITHGNEVIFSGNNGNTDRVWFNYAPENREDADTKLIEYYFGNGQKSTSGVKLVADEFTGTAAGAKVPRVKKNPSSTNERNKFKVEEYDPTSEGVPSNNWYHIYTSEGDDTNYAVQLAIGMTTNKIFLRNKQQGKWMEWKEVLLNGISPILAGDKVRMWTDGEGGNVRITAPDSYNVHWEIDAYNGNLRIYKHTNSDNKDYFPLNLTGDVATVYNLNASNNISASGKKHDLGKLYIDTNDGTSSNDTRISLNNAYSRGEPCLLLRQFTNVFQFFPNKTFASGSQEVHIGHSQYRFGSGYFTNLYNSSGLITTSDRNKKHDIFDLLDDFVEKLVDGLFPKSFKYNDGSSGRTHYGIIAQDLEKLLEELGISPDDFAPLVKVYPDKEVEYKNPDYDPNDENSEEYLTMLEKDYDADPMYNVRYDEFIMILVKYCQVQKEKNKAQDEEIQNLKEHMDNLEKLIKTNQYKESDL